jgi:hypothetical protein
MGHLAQALKDSPPFNFSQIIDVKAVVQKAAERDALELDTQPQNQLPEFVDP